LASNHFYLRKWEPYLILIPKDAPSQSPDATET
jgi:hypothetical protein